MKISDESIEAVASAIITASKSNDSPFEGALFRDEARHLALAAVITAAPCLMAQALEEAAEQLEYGNPIGSWLEERADAYRQEARSTTPDKTSA